MNNWKMISKMNKMYKREESVHDGYGDRDGSAYDFFSFCWAWC